MKFLKIMIRRKLNFGEDLPDNKRKPNVSNNSFLYSQYMDMEKLYYHWTKHYVAM